MAEPMKRKLSMNLALNDYLIDFLHLDLKNISNYNAFFQVTSLISTLQIHSNQPVVDWEGYLRIYENLYTQGKYDVIKQSLEYFVIQLDYEIDLIKDRQLKKGIMEITNRDYSHDMKSSVRYCDILQEWDIIIINNHWHNSLPMVRGNVRRELNSLLLTTYFEMIYYLMIAVPNDRIKICPKCGVLFFNVNCKKTKIFCTTKCARAKSQKEYGKRQKAIKVNE